ncbi:ADP-ribose pyrophosphatase [Rubripirellula tenax]|uniref:Nicotinamidase n=1 Tax=Rubripirellula tenax TaxID=2528015 RepID=A0A5C6FFJ3_9BACT|nr:bifunctional nicotinamidase/pyrazinamidase [Rubripirellula tenax]TWU59310.1 ADP-ribose pyrophosphatase [Rubripirellula tenax]
MNDVDAMNCTALLLVDLQNDFLPGGALAVDRGDEVIPIANQLQPYFHLVVATQDFHPADHNSFASQHKGQCVGDVIEMNGHPQVLWPDHCVQNEVGSALASDLNQASIAQVFPKGTDKRIDSYSGFFDNGGLHSTGLGDYLLSKQVTDVFIVGLATDYCVRATALDSRRLGFRTWLIEDGCRGVDLKPGDCKAAIQEMEDAGVRTISSRQWLDDKSDATKDASRTEIATGKFLSLMQSGRWEYSHRKLASDVVVIVPMTRNNEWVFIEQYRESIGKRCIEFPAGLVGDVEGDADEASMDAVRRELMEETGFEAARIRHLGSASNSAGLTDEVTSIYLAEGLHRHGQGGGVDGELIQIHLVPRNEAAAWLDRRQNEGLNVAMSVYAGLWLAAR